MSLVGVAWHHGFNGCGMAKWVWHGLSSCGIDSVGVSKASTSVSRPQCVCLGVLCPQMMWRVFSGCG